MIQEPPIVRQVYEHRLTYLEPEGLTDLYVTAESLEQQHIDGIFLEAGCALGGSAIVIAAAKSTARPLFIYDLFGMIPPPSEKDGVGVQKRFAEIRSGAAIGIEGDRYYGYEENLYQKVQDTFAAYGLPVVNNNIHLVKGLYENTLRINQPVALAHIDCDWYESVMTCLRQIEPHLVKGAVIIVDDYLTWWGCRRAVDEYFEDKRAHYQFLEKSRLHIARVANQDAPP